MARWQISSGTVSVVSFSGSEAMSTLPCRSVKNRYASALSPMISSLVFKASSSAPCGMVSLFTRYSAVRLATFTT